MGANRATTADIDDRRPRWTLGPFAPIQTLTLGRHATSQGVSDAVGKGGTVTVEVGECGYCQQFAGEAVVSQDPFRRNTRAAPA